MKKNIGILMRPDADDTGRIVFKINESIRLLFNQSDINIIPICPKSNINYLALKSYSEYQKYYLNFDKDNLDYLLKLCDGLVLPGGYGPYDYDLYIAKYAHLKNIPTLGICLGMQTMGLVLGGYLEFIENPELHKSHEKYVHNIEVKNGTCLEKILKKDNIKVNSRHKEELRIKEEFISASYDGVVEAIEDKSKNFFIGLQWHPEDLDDDNSKNIIKEFIKEVRK